MTLVLRGLWAGVATALLLIATAAMATVELGRHDLHVPGAVQRVLAEDLDGDGQRELLVFSVKGKIDPERRVSVFAIDHGTLREQPQTTWLLDPDAGMFDVGRDPNEGPSLWFFTASAVRRYRLRNAKVQTPVAETWLEAAGVLGGRADDWVLFNDFARDWHGEGADTPAIIQPGRLLLPHRDVSRPPDVVDLRTEMSVPEVPTIYDLAPGMPLLITHRLPSLTRVDVDGDHQPDLVATLGDRLEVHPGANGGAFAQAASRVTRLPSATGLQDETRRQVIQLADVTGEGNVDAVLTTVSGGIGSLTQAIDVFPGAKGNFATKPSATLSTQGAVSLTALGDVDGDKRPEITTVSVQIGVRAVLSFLLTRHMPVEFAIYAIDGEGKLRTEPLLEWTRSLRLNLSGPTDPGMLTLAGDFDGDGVHDLVSAPDDNEVEIQRIVRTSTGLALEEVLARFEAPGRGQALATDLNADGRSDLVLYAPRGTEGLVSVFLSGSPRAEAPTP